MSDSLSDYGLHLWRFRRAAGLGLRSFAALIDQRASVVSAIENGDRPAWRDPRVLARVARVLGTEARDDWLRQYDREGACASDDRLLWWNGSADAPLGDEEIGELCAFLGVRPSELTTGDFPPSPGDQSLPLTDLAIEWRARRTLSRRGHAAAIEPIDVEAALEDAGWRIVVVPGLLPRFSVSACAVRRADGQLVLLVDRIHADVRPVANYRLLLAATAAPLALTDHLREAVELAGADGSRRDCERFALAMLLPGGVVASAAEQIYADLAANRRVPSLEFALRELRNRLATQLAAPAELVERRMASWPCRVDDRVRVALDADEPSLPPLDWLPDWRPAQQRWLFSCR